MNNMKITPNILSFRYRKNYLVNYLRRKRNSLYKKNIITQSHLCCPLCKCNEGEIIAEIDREGIPSKTVICKQCGFVFNNSFIADPVDFYSRDWGEDRWGDPENNFINRTKSDAFSWKRMAYIVKNIGRDFNKIKSVFEVGCGDGCNLLPYHLIGKKVVGCDFDANFLAVGRNRGMDLFEGGIENVPAGDKFDLVMLIHSFEHMSNLDEVVHNVASRLNPGGVVFIEVPGIVNWNQTKKTTMSAMGLSSSNNIIGHLQFQHNYYFDLEHLKYVWERNGFEMIEGDEWVRAIFCKKEDTEVLVSNNADKDWKGSYENISAHLTRVEKDYLSISNLICGSIQLIIRKFCNNKN